MITLDPADYTVTLTEGEPAPPLPVGLHCLCPELHGAERRHHCGEPCRNYRPTRAVRLEPTDGGIGCRCFTAALAALGDKTTGGHWRERGDVCFAPVDVIAANRFWRHIMEESAR